MCKQQQQQQCFKGNADFSHTRARQACTQEGCTGLSVTKNGCALRQQRACAPGHAVGSSQLPHTHTHSTAGCSMRTYMRAVCATTTAAAAVPGQRRSTSPAPHVQTTAVLCNSQRVWARGRQCTKATACCEQHERRGIMGEQHQQQGGPKSAQHTRRRPVHAKPTPALTQCCQRCITHARVHHYLPVCCSCLGRAAAGACGCCCCGRCCAVCVSSLLLAM